MKRITAAILSLLFVFQNTALASVLGNTLKDSSSILMGEGLRLYKNVFLSDQKGVGNQTEYYAEYTPNKNVRPVVMTGESIYGSRNAKEAVEYMKNNNMVPMVGINASFFSFETGIPMGHVITNGVVTSKDDRKLPAIGFGADGKAFIDDLSIVTTAYFGEDYVLAIPHINKYISSSTQMLTLYTPEFGKKTGTACDTVNVVLENISGKIKIGEEFSCTVKEKKESSSPLSIGENEYILSVNKGGNQWAITLLNTLSEGDEIRIKTVANDDRWNYVYNALASEGERLLSGGKPAEGLEAGAAPRTAVGIQPDGNILFYVIDGRQKGYSYGARKDTVAKRLAELGCSEALNLDGGGSTTMAGVYPGCDVGEIINSPSEGSLRKVTNFIFLENVSEATGNAAYGYIYPYTGTVLAGSRIKLDAKAADDNFYPVRATDIKFFGEKNAVAESGGYIKIPNAGESRITASVSGVNALAVFRSVDTPSDIKLYNAETGTQLNEIYVLPGDTVSLRAESFYDGEKIMSSWEGYECSVADKKTASINGDVLTISDRIEENNTLTVKAGKLTKKYDIILGSGYNDPSAYPKAEIKYDNAEIIILIDTGASKTDDKKILIKQDGKVIPFSQYSVGTNQDGKTEITYPVGNDFNNEHHKLFVEAVLENSNACVASYDTGKASSRNAFSDTSSHWAKEIISYMNEQGIVRGSEENGKEVFRPDTGITRAEFAVIAARAMELDPDLYGDISLDVFGDSDKIPEWAKGAVRAVYAEKIIKGKEDGGKIYFDPDANVTRAEAAAIIARMLPEKLYAPSLTFKDRADIPEWAYKAFKTLSAAGLIRGYTDNTVRAKKTVTRAEAVTMFYNIY